MIMRDLYEVILSDDLTWEGLIRDIVREDQMDPWNIDITRLSGRFSQEIKKMKKIDLRVSGKFVLAASILLKMKSDFLLQEEDEEEGEESVNLAWLFKNLNYDVSPGELIPRIPMKKKRRVTLEELISALNKAIEVKDRRIMKHKEKQENMIIPLRLTRVDLTKKISEVYETITKFFKNLKKNEIKFSELLPSEDRFDIIWTFMPLMHLCNKGKIFLEQEKTFGEILVKRP
jgi:segregation and condensation protein A